ncbi:MAG: hypothetical protein MUE78_13265 [Ilumatobacteraceae bacterium]|nr:hypothetical protein [Ilumatobacteraceae bacterium]
MHVDEESVRRSHPPGQHRHGHQHEQRAGVQPGALEQVGQQRGVGQALAAGRGHRFGRGEPRPQRPEQQTAGEVVHEERRQDLVHPEERAQHGRHERPDEPAQHPGERADEHQHGPRRVADRQDRRGRCSSTDRQRPLAADREDPGAQGWHHRERHQGDRHRAHERLGDLVAAAERARHHLAVGLHRLGARDHDQQPTDEERRAERDRREPQAGDHPAHW